MRNKREVTHQTDDSISDSNNELCGLMEDKEIAARAVAFVVNSTRKGIVPLCADVANLMRSKQWYVYEYDMNRFQC